MLIFSSSSFEIGAISVAIIKADNAFKIIAANTYWGGIISMYAPIIDAETDPIAEVHTINNLFAFIVSKCPLIARSASDCPKKIELMLLNVTIFDKPVILANAPPIYLIASGNTLIWVNKDNKVEVKIMIIRTLMKKHFRLLVLIPQ